MSKPISKECNVGYWERGVWPISMEIRKCRREIRAYEMGPAKKIGKFSVAATALLVTTYIISIGFPIAIAYAPAWVAWGIGLPTVLIAGLISFVLKGMAASREQKLEALYLAYGLLTDPSRSPVGEWDLPAIDPHLRSDLLMKKELNKRHPKKPEEFARVAQKYDLELSSQMQKRAGEAFAQMSDTTTNEWAEVADLIRQAKEHLLGEEPNPAAYFQLREAALEKAWQVGGRPPAGKISFGLSFQDPVLRVLNSYKAFERLYPTLLEEKDKAEALYPGCQLEGWDWDAFEEKIKQMGEAIKPFEELLHSEDAKEWIHGAKVAQPIELGIIQLIGQAEKMRTAYVAWQEAHPSKRADAYQKELEEFEEEVFAHAVIAELERLNQKEKALQDLVAQETIRSWLEKHSDWRGVKLRTLLLRHNRMLNALDEAREAWEAHEKETKEALDTFNETYMKPLRKLMGSLGEPSKLKNFWVALTTKEKAIAKPFDPIELTREDSPSLFHKKWETIRLQNLLKDLDGKMVFRNRVRRYGLEIGALIVFTIAFSVFYGNPWVSFGLSGAILLTQLASQYVDRYLKREDRRKTALKLYASNLRDRPIISHVPGNRLELREIKQASERLGLDGVQMTWARVLVEGDSALSTRSLLLEEGQKEATRAVNSYLLPLRNELAFNPDADKKKLEERIELLEAPSKSKKLPKSSKKERKLREKIQEKRKELRKQMRELDQLTVRRMEGSILHRKYREKLAEIEQIEAPETNYVERKQESEQLAVAFKFHQQVCDLLQAAAESEAERNSTESLDTILSELKNPLVEVLQEREEQEALLPFLERLSKIPTDQLEVKFVELQVEMDLIKLSLEPVVEMHELLQKKNTLTKNLRKNQTENGKLDEKIETLKVTIATLEKEIDTLSTKMKEAKNKD